MTTHRILWVLLAVLIVCVGYGITRLSQVNAIDNQTGVQLYPEDGAVVGGNPDLTWKPLDATKVSYYIYESFTSADLKAGAFSINLTSPTRSIGGNRTVDIWWRVTVVNKDGSQDKSSIHKLSIDNTAPQASLSAQTPGAQSGYYGKVVAVTGSVAATEKNLATHTFSVKSPSGSISMLPVVSAVSNTATVTFDASEGDGVYVVSYVATDKASNKNAPVYLSLTVDTIAPEAPSLTGDPVRYMQPGTVTRPWHASSSPDVASYLYKSYKSYAEARDNPETTNINFSQSVAATTSSAYAVVGDTGALNRTFYYRVAAIDKAGNKTWSNEIFSVTVDSTPPPAPVVTTPSALTKESTTTLSWSRPSSDTAHYTLEYSMGGSGVGHTETIDSDAGSVQWPVTLADGDGTYTFKVQAIDRAGNVSVWSDGVTIALDTAAPQVTVSPITSITTPQAATISGTIDDTAVTEVALSVNGIWYGTIPVANGGYTYQLANLAAANYTIAVSATDAAGNTGQSSEQSLTVTAPQPPEVPETPVTPEPPVTPTQPSNPSAPSTPAAPATPSATASQDSSSGATSQNDGTSGSVTAEDDYSDTAPQVAQSSQPSRKNFAVTGGETSEGQQIKGTTDNQNHFAIAWWVWVVGILAAIAAWWIIAFVRRRRKEAQ